MIGQLVDGRYRILKVINSNSFGQTYLAADTHRPGYPQCIIREHSLPEANSPNLQIIKVLFQRKAEIIEKLGRSAQIPSVLAYFEEDQKLYMVEEFIVGQSLCDGMIPGQPWLENQVTNLLEEVLEILQFIHENGVIHRHLQPNHLIRRQSDGKLVLIDFGLEKEMAYHISSHQSQKTGGIGKKSPPNPSPFNPISPTLVYRPIEQLQGNPSFSSDIYAVGMIAIQCLTGFRDEDLLKMIENSDFIGEFRWRDHCSIKPLLGNIIDKMIAPVQERYQSVPEVLKDLRKMNAQKPHQKPPETIIAPPSYFIKHANRQQLLLVSMGVGVVCLVLGGGFYFWQSQIRVESQQFYLKAAEKAKSGDKEGAIRDYSQAIERNSQNTDAYYKRANVYYDMGDYAAAIKDYTQAININPTNTNALYNRGLAYYDSGDKRNAIQDFTQLIQQNPNDTHAYYQRALTYYDLGDYRTSIEDYTQVIRLDPTNPNAYSGRGLARSATGDKQGAMADYTQAISINPKDPNVYYSRGRARFNLGDYKGAVEDYTQALVLNPKMNDAYTNRASAYLNLGELQKAIEDCTQAIRLDPKDSVAYNNRCVAYLNVGNYQKAVEDCGQTIGLNPNNGKAYNNRGLARSSLGDRGGAVQDFTVAIRLNPSDAVSYTNRALIHSQMNNFKGAIEDFAQAIRLNPSSASAYYNRGLIRRQLNDKAGAQDDFQKAASLFLEQGRAEDYQKAQEQANQVTK